MSEIIERTAVEIASDVNAGRLSAREVAEATLAHVDAADEKTGAYLTVLHEAARAAAKRIDERISNGETLPLAGVPLAVKDNMCLTGTRTTCGSKILESWTAPYTATAIQRLLDAGCVPIGKTNLDEFAMGSSCENSALRVTRNPYDPRRVPGGSSGGSAAAVAAREAVVGMGSDTGGSIREPGAFCNLVGFKPTYGRVSRYGLIAFASSLDQIGPLTRSVHDAALAFDAMGGHDPMDSTSIDRPLESTATALREDLRGLRIGIVREFALEPLGAQMKTVYERAYRDLEALGAELVDVSLPTADYGVATYYLIAPAECSSNLARFDGVRYGLRVEGDDVRTMYDRTRAAGFGQEVKRRILIGTYALSSGYYDAYYVRAQKARTLIAEDFATAFSRCDLIACPATSCPPFEFNAKSDPYSMYLMDYYTIPMSLAGIPALSVPCGWVDPQLAANAKPSSVGPADHPLPIGLQLAAPHFAEALLLGAAHAYEQATRHATKHRPVVGSGTSHAPA